ncbi:MAG: sulfide/dihydroorotate dehydrogenase-like FAD/NAD-binding protein [Thermodesulfovibrionales bacterium]
MAKILEKHLIRPPDVFSFVLEAPLISRKARPGQFVIVRLHRRGERIPLSLARISPEEGAITLVVMAVGKTTREMSLLEAGDEVLDLCGPLGQPTHVYDAGRVVLVGGGFGAAPLYPIARAFREAGNEVAVILGARSAGLLIYEEELAQVSERVIIATDDGSKGMKGLVTEALEAEVRDRGAGLVVAVGPAPMMKAVSDVTRPMGIKTMVSLNPIMVDGTGMCGGCRVVVSGESRFACTDGPEFDGHGVDWENFIQRQKVYREKEKASFEEWLKRHSHVIRE